METTLDLEAKFNELKAKAENSKSPMQGQIRNAFLMDDETVLAFMRLFNLDPYDFTHPKTKGSAEGDRFSSKYVLWNGEDWDKAYIESFGDVKKSLCSFKAKSTLTKAYKQPALEPFAIDYTKVDKIEPENKYTILKMKFLWKLFISTACAVARSDKKNVPACLAIPARTQLVNGPSVNGPSVNGPSVNGPLASGLPAEQKPAQPTRTSESLVQGSPVKGPLAGGLPAEQKPAQQTRTSEVPQNVPAPEKSAALTSFSVSHSAKPSVSKAPGNTGHNIRETKITEYEDRPTDTNRISESLLTVPKTQEKKKRMRNSAVFNEMQQLDITPLKQTDIANTKTMSIDRKRSVPRVSTTTSTKKQQTRSYDMPKELPDMGLKKMVLETKNELFQMFHNAKLALTLKELRKTRLQQKILEQELNEKLETEKTQTEVLIPFYKQSIKDLEKKITESKLEFQTIIKELKNQHKIVKERLESDQQRNAAHEKEIAELKGTLENLTREKTGFQEKHQELEMLAQKTTEELKSKDLAIQELLAENQKLSETILTLKLTTETSSQQLTDLQRQFDQTQQNLSYKLDEIEKLSEKIAVIEESAARLLRKEKSAHRQQSDKYKYQIEILSKSFYATSDRVERLKKELLDREKKTVSLVLLNLHLSRKILSKENEISNLKESRERRSSEQKQIIKELTEEKAELEKNLNATRAKLEAELASVQKQISAMASKEKELITEMEILHLDLLTKESELNEKKEKLASKENKIQVLQATIETLKKSVKGYTESKQVQESLRKELTSAQETLKTEQSKFGKEKSDLLERLKKSNKMLADLNAKWTEYQEQSETKLNRVTSEHKTEMGSLIQQHKITLDGIQSELATTKKELEDMTVKFDEAISKVGHLEAHLRETRKSLSREQREKQTLQKNLDEKLAELEILAAKMEKTNSEINTKAHEILEKDEQLKLMESKLSNDAKEKKKLRVYLQSVNRDLAKQQIIFQNTEFHYQFLLYVAKSDLLKEKSKFKEYRKTTKSERLSERSNYESLLTTSEERAKQLKDKYDKSIADLDATITTLTTRLSLQQSKIDALQNDLTEKEKELKEHVSAIQKQFFQIQGLKRSLERAKTQKSSAELSRETAEKNLKNLEQKFQQLEKYHTVQCARLNSEIVRLQTLLSQSERTVEQQKAIIAEQKTKLESHKQLNEQLQAQVLRITQENTKLKGTVASLKSSIDQVNESLSRKELELNARLEELKDREKRIAANLKEIATLKSNLTSAAVTTQKQYIDQQTERSKLIAQVRTLQTEIQQKSEEIKTLTEAHSAECGNLNKQIEELKLSLQKETTEKSAMQQTLLEFKSNLLGHQKKNEMLIVAQGEHQKTVKGLTMEVAKLTKRNASLEAQNAELMDQIEKLKGKLSTQEDSLSTQNQEVQKNLADIEQLKREKASLEKSLLTSKTENETIKARVIEFQELIIDKIKLLSAQDKQRTELFKKIVGDNAELQKLLDTAKEQHRTETTDQKKLNHEAIEAIKKAHNQTIREISSDLEASKQKIIKLESENAALQTEKTELYDQLQKIETELNEKKKELTEHTLKIEELTKQLGTAKKRSDSLEKTQEIRQLREKLERLEEDQATRMSDYDKLHTKYDELTKKTQTSLIFKKTTVKPKKVKHEGRHPTYELTPTDEPGMIRLAVDPETKKTLQKELRLRQQKTQYLAGKLEQSKFRSQQDAKTIQVLRQKIAELEKKRKRLPEKRKRSSNTQTEQVQKRAKKGPLNTRYRPDIAKQTHQTFQKASTFSEAPGIKLPQQEKYSGNPFQKKSKSPVQKHEHKTATVYEQKRSSFSDREPKMTSDIDDLAQMFEQATMKSPKQKEPQKKNYPYLKDTRNYGQKQKLQDVSRNTDEVAEDVIVTIPRQRNVRRPIYKPIKPQRYRKSESQNPTNLRFPPRKEGVLKQVGLRTQYKKIDKTLTTKEKNKLAKRSQIRATRLNQRLTIAKYLPRAQDELIRDQLPKPGI